LNKVAEQHIDKKSHTCKTPLKAFNSGYELKEAMDHMDSTFKELYKLVTDLQTNPAKQNVVVFILSRRWGGYVFMICCILADMGWQGCLLADSNAWQISKNQ
jgi:hypothetical protein